eukprot:TRINITY_DN34863_c0_g1_i1.p1 TRINITY_DN34863_c0_g1~~TRINITY_DN34863_c0_g1_i1.p1  ORF type:complete len:145 (-),score=38.63 TRINITY_DN34863_c0_g1_i1:82-492(-)
MGMWHMGTTKWSGMILLLLGMVGSMADEMVEGRERDFLRLSKRDLLRLSKKSSMSPDYPDDMEYEDQDLPDLKLTKKDLLRLSKKSLFQDASPLTCRKDLSGYPRDPLGWSSQWLSGCPSDRLDNYYRYKRGWFNT